MIEHLQTIRRLFDHFVGLAMVKMFKYCYQLGEIIEANLRDEFIVIVNREYFVKTRRAQLNRVKETYTKKWSRVGRLLVVGDLHSSCGFFANTNNNVIKTEIDLLQTSHYVLILSIQLSYFERLTCFRWFSLECFKNQTISHKYFL